LNIFKLSKVCGTPETSPERKYYSTCALGRPQGVIELEELDDNEEFSNIGEGHKRLGLLAWEERTEGYIYDSYNSYNSDLFGEFDPIFR
jgi:hypothetical protein